MKRKMLVLVLLLVITLTGCVRKTPRQVIEELVVIEKEGAMVETGTIKNGNRFRRERERNEIVVLIPHEMVINENIKLTIKDDGLISFNDNVFVYSENSNEALTRWYGISLRWYARNNLIGIDITEQHSGGVASYVLVYNTETQELLVNQDNYISELGQSSSLWDFFTIGNNFIVAFGIKAFSYDNTTGELLWTQTYNMRSGRRIIIYNDSFVIDDRNGNRYRIYGDGRKEIES